MKIYEQLVLINEKIHDIQAEICDAQELALKLRSVDGLSLNAIDEGDHVYQQLCRHFERLQAMVFDNLDAIDRLSKAGVPTPTRLPGRES